MFSMLLKDTFLKNVRYELVFDQQVIIEEFILNGWTASRETVNSTGNALLSPSLPTKAYPSLPKHKP